MRREVSPGKEGTGREEPSGQHHRHKVTLDKDGYGYGRRYTHGDDDTCVGYASQRRTPRPREWGEAR